MSEVLRSDPLFNSLKLIKIYDLTYLAMLTFMFRVINNFTAQ